MDTDQIKGNMYRQKIDMIKTYRIENICHVIQEMFEGSKFLQ